MMLIKVIFNWRVTKGSIRSRKKIIKGFVTVMVIKEKIHLSVVFWWKLCKMSSSKNKNRCKIGPSNTAKNTYRLLQVSTWLPPWHCWPVVDSINLHYIYPHKDNKLTLKLKKIDTLLISVKYICKSNQLINLFVSLETSSVRFSIWSR